MVSISRTPLRRTALLGTATFLGLVSLAAQTIKVEVPATVIKGRPFQLVYLLQGSAELERLDAPKLSGLNLLYGPARQTSSSFSSVNGRTTSSVSTQLTYTLLADKVGTVSIAPTTAVVGGRQVQVRGASIKVLQGEQGQQAAQASRVGHYLYRAIPGRSSVYEQEAIPMQYKLYASTEFEIASLKAPEYEGFLSQMEPDDGRRQLVLESYQGRNWRTVVMRQEVLFPQRSGQLTIPASEIGLRVPAPIAQDEDDFFIGAASVMERTVSSAPVTITVKPLPTEGRPADFSGAVGAFTMKAELLSKKLKTNEALTLRITLQGQGNLKLAKAPEVKFPDTFEVYDPKESYEQKVGANNVQGHKVIDYYAIPKRVGIVTIPAVSFSYFNPQTQRYETIRSQSFRLDIAQGKNAPQDEVVSADQQLLSLAPLKQELGARAIPGLGFVQSFVYYLSFVFIALAALLGYVLLRRRRALLADSVGYRASKASKVATRRLRTAHELLTAGKREAFYEELTKALWGYLGDKLRLPLSELSRSSISDLLRERQLPDELIAQLTDLLDAADFARYAPAQEGDMQQLYDDTARLISQMDSHHLSR